MKNYSNESFVLAEIREVSEKLWLFNHKRADFWFPNFGFERSLLSLLKAVFHWAEFSSRSDIFSSKISALNFDLISTSILPKAKTVPKRRNKMSAVEKRKKLLVLICIAKKKYSKAKSTNTGKDFGSDGLFELKNRMKKGNFKKIFQAEVK